MQRFKITYKTDIFNFEYDSKNGFVWLIRVGEIPNRINQGQIKPARNIDEAKIVTENMLYSMGY